MHRQLKPIRAAIYAVFLLGALLLAGCAARADSPSPEPAAIRVAYFPNITHVQPLVGLSRGTFQEAMGSVAIKTKVFNAGPSEIEALFAGEIDIGYIGPSPAVNGYVQSKGKALRIVAGAASGGAALVVREDSGIKGPRDLAGKKIASPQLGNTQDVALRYYLAQNGLKPKEKGGSVEVIPIGNPDILSLFLRKELDGAWVPEPWTSRLIKEAGARILVDERDLWPNGQFATTVVIVRKQFLDAQPGLVNRWLEAHVAVTEWANQHPDEARRIVQKEIATLTGARLSDDIVRDAMGRLRLVNDPLAETIQATALHAYDLGFLGSSKPDLGELVDPKPLQVALAQSPALGLESVT